jgi:hypothetical protein
VAEGRPCESVAAGLEAVTAIFDEEVVLSRLIVEGVIKEGQGVIKEDRV